MYQDKAAIGYASAVRGSRHTSKLSQLDRLTPAFQERGKQQAVSRTTTVLYHYRSRVALSLRSKRVPLDSPPVTTSAPLCLSFLAPKASPRARSPYGDGAKLASITHLTFYFSIFGAKNGTIRPSLCCSINPSPNENSSRLITIELGSKSLNR